MNILITGYTGFVGSSLLNFLIKKKFVKKVYCLGRKKPSHNLKVIFIKKSLDRKFKLKKVIIDIVIHLAAANEVDSINKSSAYKNTFLTTINLIRALKKFQIKKFLYFSTAQVYGSNHLIDEKTATNSQNNYSLTHELSELFIKMNLEENIKNYIIVRPFNIFGSPKNKSVKRDTLVPICFVKEIGLKNSIILKSNGEQTRDFISQDDINKRILKIIIGKKFDNKIINLCSGTSLKIIDVAKITKKIYEEKFKKRSRLIINNSDKKKYPQLKAKSKFFQSISKKEIILSLNKEIKKLFYYFN